MALFPSLFRSRPREQESPPPLPPRPGQTAKPTPAGIPTEAASSSSEQYLKDETKDGRESPVYDGFESLCKRYEEQLLDLQSLRSAHQVAASTIKQLQSQLAQTVEERQKDMEARRSEFEALSKQLMDATTRIKQLRSQKDQKVVNLRTELRQQQENFANKEKKQRTREERLKDENVASSNALACANQALQEQRIICAQVAQRAEEATRLSKALASANQALQEQRIICEQVAQRAEEATRLPQGILRSTFAARFVQPFVVVLIDGDAYKFTHELTRDSLHGGARAAHRIKTEVLNYMATHEDIPLHSKIIVRVFFNAGSQRGKLGKDGLRGTATGHKFMIQFSETHPLFDFLDCGSGKERADTKIRQNFELFIDNPYCRAMFLAVCYDGGFVRMLEPYQHSEDALNKICLIKAGQVAPGFLSVPRFKLTEFTSVFHELYSLKVGPIGKTLCGADKIKLANLQTEGVLPCGEDSEPENLPIGNVHYDPWKHPRSYVRSTATLVGLAHKATLLSAKSRGAIPTPELIALRISSFQLCGSNDSTTASPTAGERRRKKTKIKGLESAIRQKQQAAKQPGISTNVQNILRRTARSLKDEVAQLSGR